MGRIWLRFTTLVSFNVTFPLLTLRKSCLVHISAHLCVIHSLRAIGIRGTDYIVTVRHVGQPRG